jgi:hypothetical protein
MWGKIYLGFFAVSAALLCFVSYYAWTWLQSIGAPQPALDGYSYHASIFEVLLWASTLGLLALANGVLWLSGRVWAMWMTFFFFLIFKIGSVLWLGNAMRSFVSDAGGSTGGMISSLIIAVILTGLIGAIIFFDQFIVTKMREKTFPEQDADIEMDDEAEIEKPAV